MSRKEKDFLPGATLNRRYMIIRKIDDGGMGSVVEAKRIRDGKRVAIKYCASFNKGYIRRFSREVRIMKKIKHAHVVPVLNTGLRHDPPYFVMPLADGSMGKQLSTLAGDEDLALSQFLELCKGVEAVHNADAVHRDIKPDNALYIGGKVVVSDLGLAKLNERDSSILTQTMAIVGTQAYLAPEQRLPAGSRDADPRTDIYQLGKTLYQLLTGSDPLLVDSSKLPPGLAHIVRKSTHDHPKDRYQHVSELMDAIEVYRQAKNPEANPLGAFEAITSRIEERLKNEEYRETDVRQLLAIMVNPAVTADDEQFLELFDRIPSGILRVAASTFADTFVPVLKRYVRAIEELVGGKSFSYGEHVARMMRPICDAKDATPELKSLAIEAVLLAGVRLNRFAAISAFDAMLIRVDNESAFEVLEMLRRRHREYRQVFGNVPSIKLNPVIRVYRDELAAAKEE